MVIRYRGTPPSLAVAKGSAHTHMIMFPSLEVLLMMQACRPPSMASTLIRSASISSSVAGPKWSASLFALGSGAGFVGERSNFKKNPTHTQDHGDA